MAEKEKWVTVEDGWGMRRRIPESKVEWAENQYKNMREWSQKAGEAPEITARYTLKITRDEE